MTAVGVVIQLCVRACLCAKFCQMSETIDLYFSPLNKHTSMMSSQDEEGTAQRAAHERTTRDKAENLI